MRVYVTGADGMLGTALIVALREDPATAGWPLLGVSLDDFDIGEGQAIRASVAEFRPDAVIHTAAHAIVDDCEADPKLALRVNVAGVYNIADACRAAGSRLVYISSDYVFDGAATPPGGYREGDIPNPLSTYGLTKLAGERIAGMLDSHLNVRTSWLFGGNDERVDTVLATVRQAGRGERPRLITDQFSLPTYAADLAQALIFLLARPALVGTIHAANRGTASWYQVGTYLLSELDSFQAGGGAGAEPVALADCGFLGQRPGDSTLNTDRLAELGFRMPDWRDAVTRFCRRLGATDPSNRASFWDSANG